MKVRARLRRPLVGGRGFSLIETIVAVMIFLIVTVGLVPVILASLRGSSLSRAGTVGKNVALQAMERARGLPFFVSYGDQQGRVDLLDLYFPDADGVAADGVTYVTECPADGAPACPPDLPDDYELTFEAQFVQQISGTDPEEYEGVAPSDAYDSGSTTTETPPRRLVQLSITSEWTFAGQPRTYRLTSLLADRRFGEAEGSGEAVLDYVVRAVTGFSTSPAATLTATGGSGSSTFELGRVLSAAQEISAGTIDLRNTSTNELITQCGTGGTSVCEMFGAAGSMTAPGDADSPAPVTTSSDSIADTGTLLNVGGMSTTQADTVDASVEGATPFAEGEFEYLGGSSSDNFWITRPSSLVSSGYGLNAASKLLTVVGSGPLDAMSGRTFVDVQDDEVVTGAAAAAYEIRLLPTTFISAAPCMATAVQTCDAASLSADRRNTAHGGAVIAIRNFSAEVECVAPTLNSAGGTVSVSYSGDLYYWRDVQDNGVKAGSYVKVSLTGAGGQLEALYDGDGTGAFEASGGGAMPLVRDESSANSDVYLFPFSSHSHTGNHGGGLGCGNKAHCGYLSDWSDITPPAGDTQTVSTTDTADDDGISAEQALSGAVSIATHSMFSPSASKSPTDTSVTTVSLASMSCDAQDLR